MKSRIGTVIVSLSLLTMISTAVFGYALLSPTRRWFPADLPVDIRVDNRGVPSVNDAQDPGGVNAAVNAVNAWTGGGLTMNGHSGTVTYTQGDGQVDIIFADPRHLCTGSCIAATLTGYYDTGQTGTCGGTTMLRLTDADVAFNMSFNFQTVGEDDPCSNEIYLESVVTHEVGHVIGLAHSSVSSALMYPSVSYCVNKTIASDDRAGRDALYNCSFSGGGGGCTLGQPGDPCTSGNQCCSGSCKGKPGFKTCR